MSSIGKNIRKIRSIKKLSQSEFAELFDLKRASIGSYEEGRAEPKMDVIIRIARHFNISLDDLLTKELTVNQLYNFDIFDAKPQINSNFIASSSQPNFSKSIELVNAKNHSEYALKRTDSAFLAGLETISLPVVSKISMRAFEFIGNEMQFNNVGIFHGDLLLGNLIEPITCEAGFVYIFVTSSEIIIRRLSNKSTDGLLKLDADNPNFKSKNLTLEEISETWQVVGIYSQMLKSPNYLDKKILEIESKIN